jgi:hypothetical protein
MTRGSLLHVIIGRKCTVDDSRPRGSDNHPIAALLMSWSKIPARWPNNVEYLAQSCLDPKFPKELRELLVVGPDVPPSQLATRSSHRIPVTIKMIDNPNHPAFGQRGMLSYFIYPGSRERSYTRLIWRGLARDSRTRAGAY